MANGRNKAGRGPDSGRDPGGFSAIPWSVQDCPAFFRLSMHARSLLLEVARQFVRDNNGRLLLSRAYMATRGWKSVDMLSKAKAELLAGGFVFQTVMGHRPNKASWFAVTWRNLDRLPGFDEGAYELFERGAYRKGEPQKNAVLRPSRGTGGEPVVPPHGTSPPRLVPQHGPISRPTGLTPVPPYGHHLEMPSTHVDSRHRDRWRYIELALSAVSNRAGQERAGNDVPQLTIVSVGAPLAPAPPPLRVQLLARHQGRRTCE
jgi:hypothetical protein